MRLRVACPALKMGREEKRGRGERREKSYNNYISIHW
jgi:hypothetical protein